jgi:hypothetical protein
MRSDARAGEPAGWTEHVAPLVPGWGIWRHVGLRGAGFPAERVAFLAQPDTARAADALIAREDELRAAQSRPSAVRAATAEARARFAGALAADLERVGDALSEAAAMPELREAIVWQNRDALVNGLDSLVRHADEASNRDARKKHELVAKYLTRYCLKNDTIGFFGPMGWGRIDPGAPAVAVRPGRHLIADRMTRFEHWCIDSLAARLSSDPRLRPWLPPRRLPLVRLEGTEAHPVMGAPVALTAASARALSLCTGERPARHIAAALQADAALGVASEADAFAVLGDLERRGWIRWVLEVPNIDPYPERVLRRRLEAIDDPGLRAAALAPLDDLEAKRDAVARSAGDAAALAAALDQLNETFSAYTGAPAHRREGQTYAGRALVYEDCRRDVELTIGDELLRPIGPPLGLLADSARWLTAQLGAVYQAMFDATFDRLRGNAPTVGLLPFHLSVSKHLPFLANRAGMGVTPELARDTIAEFQRRWATLLPLTPGERRVQRSSAELAGPARTLFAADGPGWPTARYFTSDLMIAAQSAEAIRRGDFLAVLGEVHMAINTLESPGPFFLHPRPHELVAALDADLPHARIAPTVPKDRATRATIVPFSSTALELAYDLSLPWRPPSSVRAMCDLVVERLDRSLMVRSRDGEFRIHLLATYDWLLSFQFKGAFKLWPRQTHAPRVTIDNLVIHRETWRFATRDLAFIHLKDPTERYLAARRWARDHGLPERTFFRASSEIKPFVLDLTSPILSKVFCRMARASEEVMLAEILPDVGALWLTDAQGRAYTSEFRMVIVDQQPFRDTPAT